MLKLGSYRETETRKIFLAHTNVLRITASHVIRIRKKKRLLLKTSGIVSQSQQNWF